MSLSDRYNRGDGRIQMFDRYLTDIGNRLGNFWTDQTGWSRQSLTQGLYVLSALAAAQHAILFRDSALHAIACIALLCYMGMGHSKGGLVEQIQAQAAGLPKNTIALMRLQILLGGVWLLAIAATGFTAALSTDVPLVAKVVEPLLSGLALAALQASDYIRRTNPVTPGKGGKGKLVRAGAS